MPRSVLVLGLALLALWAAPAARADLGACGSNVAGFETASSASSTVLECSISAPTSGTAIVVATSGLRFVNSDYEALLSVSVDSSTIPAFGDPHSRYVNIYGDAGGNGTDKSTMAQATFAVAPGTHTYRLLALRQAGTGTVGLTEPSLTVIFVPTSEPGVRVCSSNTGETYINSTTTFSTLASCSINAPSTGFMLGIGSGSAALSGGAYEANFRLGVGEASGSAETDRYVNVYPDSGDGTDESLAVQFVKPVGGGTHTLSMIGQRFGSNSGTGTVQVYDPGLVGLFIPADSSTEICSAGGSDTYDNATTIETTVRSCSLTLSEPSRLFGLVGGGAAMAFPQGVSQEWEGSFGLSLAGSRVNRALNVYYDGGSGDGTDRSLAASRYVGNVPAGIQEVRFSGRRVAGSGTVRLFSAGLVALAIPGVDQAPPTSPPPGPPPPASGSFGTDPKVTLKLADSSIRPADPLPITIANGNPFTVIGTLTARTKGKVSVRPAGGKRGTKPKRRVVKLGSTTFKVAAKGTSKARLSLPAPLRKLLKQKRKLSLLFTAKVLDPSGQSATVRLLAKPKLEAKKRKKGKQGK